jgi:hypothetical protein
VDPQTRVGKHEEDEEVATLVEMEKFETLQTELITDGEAHAQS